MTPEFRKLTRPLVILFIVSTALFLAFRSRLEPAKLNVEVLIWANVLLFAVTMLNLYFQFRNLQNPNPNAVIRGVMAATFLKLLVLGAAVIIYLVAAGKARNVNAVFGGMALYIIYTWLEVRISLKLNPKK